MELIINSKTMINSFTEIRKLPSAATFGLVKILEESNSWALLMSIIPSGGRKESSYKYSADHIRLIETEAPNVKRSCSEILLDEWGTSGRIRPTVGLLLELLIEANLYRAADYVSMEILKEGPVKRPSEGPAAKIDTTLPAEPPSESMEQFLYGMNYPSSALDMIQTDATSHDNNKDFCDKVLIKQIPHLENSNPTLLSDLIKFESVEISESNKTGSVVSTPIRYSQISEIDRMSQLDNTPDFSTLLNGTIENPVSLRHSSSVEQTNIALHATSTDLAQTSGYLPNLSALDIPSTTSQSEAHQSIPSTHYSTTNGLLPNLSFLNINSTDEIQSQENLQHDIDNLQNNSESYALPNLSQLNLNDSQLLYSNKLHSYELDIITDVPHFSYEQLKKHTNNFNDDLYGIPDGRKLGSGAFGTIYWANDLFKEAVAVKKLHIIDLDNSKQFKNEVEIMSNYKHRNLLKLMGYSTDGPTFCLVYEYMQGGSLKDRLQDKTYVLKPQTRIDIAVGCAEGINYLHNANDIPLIHRDVKSANILLDHMALPKLSDFGLIKLTQNGSNSMKATTILGTSAYMSPEAHRGDISVKMDCYSFGVVILELITSLPPLDEEREGCDLVTHIEQHCDDTIEGIDCLVDITVGSWIEPARELYRIALSCLLDKRKRPFIKDILVELKKITFSDVTIAPVQIPQV